MQAISAPPSPVPAGAPACAPTPAGEVAAEVLAGELLTLMTYIQKQSGEGFLAMVERHDLGLTQIKALLVLERRAQELSVKELAEHLGLSLAATSRTSEGLLQRGYVERREDEHDRRIKRVGLTGAGREIALALHRERLAGLEAFASSLSPRQRRRLSGALASLLEREEIAACHASSGAGARG